ncbi:MAG TPA: LpqB family beta-propeller domain-containing protein [Candidatus Methylomirabilis sp.]
MLKTGTLLLSLLILAMPAKAELYKWVDEEGTLHVTPDFFSIPERYRQGAQSIEEKMDISTLKGQIAFVSNREGNPEIYRMDADGSHVTRLTHKPAADQSPAWSPDGQSLAFMSERDGNWEIYVMDADGSHVRNLTNDPGDDGFPTWSPDGRRIAFVSKRAGISEIYVMDRDGSHVKRLTHTGMDVAYLAWSPDGGRIAFVADKSGNSEIYTVNADGSNLRNLTNSKIGNWHPAWSPDGKSIVFASDREGAFGIYRMAADGSRVTRLTRTGGVNADPVWSPDGKSILFASDREGPLQLYLMNARGFDVTRLTRSESRDGNPAWTASPRSATFPVEALYAPSDGRDWWVGHKADVGAVRNIEFVLPGERVESWRELVSFQFFGDPTFPSPQAAMDGLRTLMKERCQNTVWNVLRQDENSVLYEWRISDCPGQPDQHEIARFLRVKEGTHRIAYVVKAKEILPSRRDQWIDLLWQVRRQERIE